MYDDYFIIEWKEGEERGIFRPTCERFAEHSVWGRVWVVVEGDRLVMLLYSPLRLARGT